MTMPATDPGGKPLLELRESELMLDHAFVMADGAQYYISHSEIVRYAREVLNMRTLGDLWASNYEGDDLP